MAREFTLLTRIFEKNALLESTVLIPPGDDLGMVRLASGALVLSGVDQVVEGRHFDGGCADWSRIGRKAVARSLSDVAAMAAEPVSALATCVLPPDFAEEKALALFEGMRACGEEFHCPLIGGDIASGAGPVVCTVTVLAEPGVTGRVVERSGGAAGDCVYVTGRLGGAWRTERHLDFKPRIELALELVKRFDLHAMIDLSDGLGRDLDHLAARSNLHAEIEARLVPCQAGCDWEQAVGDGEDYELCFAVAEGLRLPSELLGVALTPIGRLLEPANGRMRTVVLTPEGERRDASALGWEHGSGGGGDGGVGEGDEIYHQRKNG